MKTGFLAFIFVFGFCFSARAQTLSFEHETIMRYCGGTSGPTNFDIWFCRDQLHRDYQALVRLPYSQNDNIQKMLELASNHCKNEWFPRWDMALHCAKRELEAGIRIDMMPVNSARKRLVKDLCVEKFAGNLWTSERCIHQTMRALEDK